MRFSLWLLLATTVLAACSDGAQEAKMVKATSLSSKQEVRLRVAHATEEGGDLGGAEKAFLQVALQAPGSPDAQVELAEFYRRHHADQKAIESLNAALKLDPVNTGIKRELANIYIGTGEPEKALALLDSAIETSRQDPLLYNSKGVALDETGNYAEAQRNYKAAYDLDPVGGMTYKVNISMSYILAGQYDKSIALLRPMLDAPDAPPIIRQNLALAYGMKGDNDEALKLGLQDLSNSEVEENIRFYRMMAQKHAGGIAKEPKPVAVTTVPAADIQDLFPDKNVPVEAPPVPAVVIPRDSKPVRATAAAVNPVSVHDKEEDDDDTDDTAPSAAPKPLLKTSFPVPGDIKDSAEPAPTSMTYPDASSLPEPVLKPDIH